MIQKSVFGEVGRRREYYAYIQDVFKDNRRGTSVTMEFHCKSPPQVPQPVESV